MKKKQNKIKSTQNDETDFHLSVAIGNDKSINSISSNHQLTVEINLIGQCNQNYYENQLIVIRLRELKMLVNRCSS